MHHAERPARSHERPLPHTVSAHSAHAVLLALRVHVRAAQHAGPSHAAYAASCSLPMQSMQLRPAWRAPCAFLMSGYTRVCLHAAWHAPGRSKLCVDKSMHARMRLLRPASACPFEATTACLPSWPCCTHAKSVCESPNRQSMTRAAGLRPTPPFELVAYPMARVVHGATCHLQCACSLATPADSTNHANLHLARSDDGSHTAANSTNSTWPAAPTPCTISPSVLQAHAAP